MSQLLNNLNPEQKQAVEHTDGPLLIVAGAGTGKTYALTRKIAYLIEKGLAKPDEILALTFTDKAAGEMEERVDRLLPYGYVDLWISTFHSFCERILKNHGVEIGLPEFKLFSTTDAWILMRKNFDKFDLDYYKPMGNPTKFIHALLSHFSRAKDEIISPQEYLKFAQNARLDGDSAELVEEEKKKLMEVANAYHSYNQLLLEEGALDFGDLINYTYKLLKTRKSVLKAYQDKFKYILVDEFQDTNFAQYELIKLLAAPKNNFTVVGDDDQSIYRFRGASMSNILTFNKDFPDAKRVVLVKNYRTGQKILDTAYEFIKQNNPNRLEASLSNLSKKLDSQIEQKGEVEVIKQSDLEEEVGAVMRKIIEIKEKENASWNDFAILVRANESAKPFIHQAEVLGIPYEFLASRGLYTKPAITWIISFLKLLDNYRESSAMYNVLLMPVWGLTAYQISNINYHAKKKAESLYEACEHIELYTKDEKLINKIKEIINFINKKREDAKILMPSQIIYGFLQDSGVLKHFSGLPDGREKKNNFAYLNRFYKKVKEFEKNQENTTLDDFMRALEMELEAGEQGALPYDPTEGPEMIKIMTIHGSKGLEFKYVFIVSLVDKRFPSIERKEPISLPEGLIKEILPEGDIHLEEERRLFYVACTRAKEKLFLTWAPDYGGVRAKKPSRFLYEMNFIKPEQANTAPSPKRRTMLSEQKQIKNDEHKIYSLPKHFSYSQLAAFRKCPYQYKMRFLLNIPTEAGFQASFGRSIHNTLEKFFIQIKTSASKNQGDLFGKACSVVKLPGIKSMEEIYEKEWINEWYQSREEMERHKKIGLESLRKYYKKLEENPPNPLYLEQEFTLKFGDDSFKGVIDRIDKIDEKKIIIMDYKTSAKAPEKLSLSDKEQLLIYYMACKEVLELEPQKLNLNYIVAGKELEFEATEKDIIKTREKIVDTISEIKKFNFKENPSEHNCKFCDYKNICEYRK